MEYNHEAIYKAYPNVETITDNEPIYDKNNKLVKLDQAKIDAAAIEVEKEKYWMHRQVNYPDWGEQLDYIYHHGIDKWKTDMIDPVKAKYPKPE
jgi:hypothetical protein